MLNKLMGRTTVILTIISLVLILVGCRNDDQPSPSDDDSKIPTETKNDYPDTPDVLANSFTIDYYHNSDVQNCAKGMLLIHKTDTFNSNIAILNVKWGTKDSPLDTYNEIVKFDNMNAGEFEYNFSDYALIPLEATKIWVEGIDETNTLVDKGCITVEKYKKNYELKYEFQVISDVHISSSPVFTRHAEKAFEQIKTLSPNSALIAVNGDIVDDMNTSYYDQFYASYHKTYSDTDSTKLLVGLGNHEFIVQSEDARYTNVSESELQQRYYDRLALWKQKTGNDSPYFYYESNGSYFIFLGTTKMPEALDGNTRADCTLDDAEFNWLRDVLTEAGKSEKPIYLFSHGSFRDTVSGSLTDLNQTWYGYSLDQENKLKDIIKDYPQILMFSGHSHWSFESKSPYVINENYPSFLNTASVGYLWEGTGSGQHYEGGTYENGGSQGLFIEVYENQMIIKGRQFEASDGISQYWNSSYQVVIPL